MISQSQMKTTWLMPGSLFWLEFLQGLPVSLASACKEKVNIINMQVACKLSNNMKINQTRIFKLNISKQTQSISIIQYYSTKYVETEIKENK